MAQTYKSVGLNARKQSSLGPPVMERVKVAVLTPPLPPGLAPPRGQGAAGCFSYEETINWQQNNKGYAPGDPPPKEKGFWDKIGFTTIRARKNPNAPPYTWREVSYDIWRKHYAKDKDGYYKGTLAPASDCLLKEEDLQKWRLTDGSTYLDKWTRGLIALPVYDEIAGSAQPPEYKVECDGPSRENHPDSEQA